MVEDFDSVLGWRGMMYQMDADDLDRMARANHVGLLVRSITDECQNVSPLELTRAYREISLAPLLGELQRQKVGVEINKTGKTLDVIAEAAPTAKLEADINKNHQALVELLTAHLPEKSKGFAWETAKAVMIASRYVFDRAQHHLLTSSETDILATAMAVVFEKSLKAQIEANHPGDVMGHA